MLENKKIGDKEMKTLKFIVLAALMVCGINAMAGNHDNLVYNNEEYD